MNAPPRPTPSFRLDDYPFRLTDNVRYGDLDPNKHVNNAVYGTYFETARVTLLRSGDRGLMPKGLSWMLVHLAVDFRAEMHWPGSFELGIGGSRHGSGRRANAQAVTAHVRHHRTLPAVAAEKLNGITPDAPASTAQGRRVRR